MTEKEGIELQLAKETQKLNWYVCTPVGILPRAARHTQLT